MQKTFVSASGELLNSSTFQTVRADYSRNHREIDTTLQLRATLRAGPYAWPGGYPLFLWTNDGAALCFACGRAEYAQISSAINTCANNGWRVVGSDINFEDSSLICEHCNKRIPAAYGNDEPDETDGETEA